MSNTVKLSSGQVLNNVHDQKQCSDRSFCAIHNPTDHEFLNLPQYFNGVHMVRIQKDGTHIIDPDDYIFNEYGSAILRNSAKCLNCNQEIVSSHRHDYVSCKCENVFVDGGLNYLRRGIKDKNAYEDTSVIVEK